MKKAIFSILAAMTILTIGTATVSAANTPAPAYIDEDQDGICDRFSSTKKGSRFTDTDNDGICDYAQKNREQGPCHGQRQGNGNRRCGMNKR